MLSIKLPGTEPRNIPVKMKVIEAIRIIDGRESATKKAANRERQRKRHRKYRREKKEALRLEKLPPAERIRAKHIQKVRKSLGLEPDKKAEWIERTCSCGRKFRVLTYHKGMKRKRCRVCKPH